MNKVYFGICLHFHQPVGNFDEILERAYQNCYRPFLDVFEKFPDIKMSMHFSGCLLDYFEAKHPDYLDRIKVMVDRGQVEIVGGGYYEPIFTSIPHEDRAGQIEMMSGYIKKRFGQKAIGLWTPERVWVPGLAKEFSKAGVKYTILDDEHFIKAGLKQEDLLGYFTTGEKNAEIEVFPSNKPLRYMIPFKMPTEVINYFKEAGSKSKEPLFTYGDDAEKFGEWPSTNDWVYGKNWLSNFFTELVKNKEWLITVKLSDCLKSRKPLKKIKIPEASYQEMMEWSHGSWMNFLKKYPETNQMVRKMHYVSKKVNSLGDKSALRELYKGECNCAYWHGVFGGLYLYHLRKAVYEHLINAEKIVECVQLRKLPQATCEVGQVRIEEVDFYEDGKKAFIVSNKALSLCIDPANGGIIRELDNRRVSTNLVNPIARHEEEYHKKILAKMGKSHDEAAIRTIHEDTKVIDPALKSEFCYDDYIRGCLVDRFMDSQVNIDDFMECKSNELGDFVNAVYKGKKERYKVVLDRRGSVAGKAVSITKEICLRSANGGGKEIEISYTLKNLSKQTIDAIFGVEFNFTMPYLNSGQYKYFAGDKILGSLNEKGAVPGPGLFSIKDSSKEIDINFEFSQKPKDIWYFPVKTVSQSERAYELNFQASCILPRWHISISPGRQIALGIILTF
ncbi:MAG: DUF1926 domain-containing protein [Candidatus Omnitrophota bacterium]|nr:DUF1926 domain-containing protein [Candidatus Omnitrophota bacterium]